MTLPPEKAADLRVKYLELVQQVVSRMAGNGAATKNYCITLATAVCGFAITLQRPAVALLAFLPLIACALLDAQYLRMERRFRQLFDQSRSEDWTKMPSFEIDLKAAPYAPYRTALFSWSISSFYGPLALGVGLVVIIARSIYGA
jgi:histidine triad (HIT) family protein